MVMGSGDCITLKIPYRGGGCQWEAPSGSPTKLKKIRVVHVLDSHARRQTAREYVWGTGLLPVVRATSIKIR